MQLLEDLERIRNNPRATLALARRALNQWLDAPDDRVARPLFVFGCQRSGTTMLIDTLMAAPDLWVHPEKSRVAYDDFRLRPPRVVDLVTRLTPARVAIYKPLCDSHLADRILAAHPGSQAVWVVRRWEDVARSAVRKWGPHQAEVVRAIARGDREQVGWRGERLPEALVHQLAELVDDELSDTEGAALFWYLRNSFFFALGLDHDPRVALVRYEDLVQQPEAAFRPIFERLEAAWDPRWVEAVTDASVTTARPDDVRPRVAALCDALQQRFDEAVLARR